MPYVQFDECFFKKERRTNYANWESAVWRELTQNAADQAASRIDIWLSAAADGTVSLIFWDNGPGMTRHTLDTVYFSIGASTKDNDPTKIGGMGRARMLTCFAMQSYRILSQDYEVIGNGGYYDTVDHAWTDGCKLILVIDDTDLETMQKELERFLYESRLTARVFLNGERWISKSVNSGKHIRDLEIDGETFASVYVNKSATTQRVIVRVNGVSMYTIGTNAKAQVVVELEQSVSRKALTASRDGLRYEYREALDKFLRELAVDTNSALKSRFGRRTVVARGGGMKALAAAAKKKEKKLTKAAIAAAASRLAGEAIAAAATATAIAAVPYQPSAFYETRTSSSKPAAEVDDVVIETVLPKDTFDEWLRHTFGDIYIFDETESAKIGKVIPQYQPENWKEIEISVGNGSWTDGEWHQPTRKHRKGGHIIRVLLLWQVAVRYALEVSLETLNLSRITYAVGFTFPNDLRGSRANHREQDGGHIFSLCPVDENGKMDYAITDRTSLKRMMAYAKHEVTHVSTSWHGEDFSSLREAIDINFEEAECFRRMKQALRDAKV